MSSRVSLTSAAPVTSVQIRHFLRHLVVWRVLLYCCFLDFSWHLIAMLYPLTVLSVKNSFLFVPVSNWSSKISKKTVVNLVNLCITIRRENMQYRIIKFLITFLKIILRRLLFLKFTKQSKITVYNWCYLMRAVMFQFVENVDTYYI